MCHLHFCWALGAHFRVFNGEILQHTFQLMKRRHLLVTFEVSYMSVWGLRSRFVLTNFGSKPSTIAFVIFIAAYVVEKWPALGRCMKNWAQNFFWKSDWLKIDFYEFWNVSCLRSLSIDSYNMINKKRSFGKSIGDLAIIRWRNSPCKRELYHRKAGSYKMPTQPSSLIQPRAGLFNSDGALKSGAHCGQLRMRVKWSLLIRGSERIGASIQRSG